MLGLNLTFHELATNAAKHEALSAPSGRVDCRSFESRLMERGLPQEFGAEVALAFAPAGVECRIRLPAAKNVLTP